MASKPSNKPQTNSVEQIDETSRWKTFVEFFHSEMFRVITAVILLGLSAYAFFSMVSFLIAGAADQSVLQYDDPIQKRAEIHNWCGVEGALFSQWIINGAFGLASFVLLFGIVLFGLWLLNAVKIKLLRLFIKTVFWTVWGSAMLSFVMQWFDDKTFLSFGGAHGELLSGTAVSYINPLGFTILMLVCLIVFLVCMHKGFWPWVKSLWPRFMAWRERRKQEKERKRQLQLQQQQKNTQSDEDDPESPEEPDDSDKPVNPDNSDDPENPDGVTITFGMGEDSGTEGTGDTGDDDDDSKPDNRPSKNTDTEFVINTPDNPDETDEPKTPDTKDGKDGEDKDGDKSGEEGSDDVEINITKPEDTDTSKQLTPLEQYGPYDPHAELSHYKFPPLDLLKTYPDENKPVIDMEEQQANKEKIVKTLADYGIGVERINATIGPTITLYEIVPKAGIRVNKIRNLENDIMLSLAATGIRIIAPIPGKGTVGIEVPNKNSQIVSMHSVIASRKFQEESKYALPVALGRTITNEVFMFDLAKAPHLLVAGATGQGKSVGLNAIITSLLYKKHPSELKFVLVDPKMVEFNIYAKIEKQYMAKLPEEEDVIITDSTKVIQTLNSLVVEMEDRYKLLMKAGCRNIVEYNEKFVNRQLSSANGHRFLPYIVIVIDEFGDFIMVAGKEVEMPISRITQKARAVGMHMILATQRPSVNVITGIIKANIPARIAFRVQSQIDSRTILDGKGADQLVGRGDMLYSNGNDPVRVQCAFVDTPEVESITKFVSEQQAYPHAYELPEYVPESGDAEGGLKPGEVDTSHLDPMFADVARFVVTKQQGSTSVIQRMFNIGYNRAGRLSDQLEATGIVGPNNGPKGRAVLVQDEMTLAEIFSRYNVF